MSRCVESRSTTLGKCVLAIATMRLGLWGLKLKRLRPGQPGRARGRLGLNALSHSVRRRRRWKETNERMSSCTI
jgi:hypothetical protein